MSRTEQISAAIDALVSEPSPSPSAPRRSSVRRQRRQRSRAHQRGCDELASPQLH